MGTTDTEIEDLVRAFEDGSLPRAEWTLARYLFVALSYVIRHGRDRATGLIRPGIRRYNERQGNPGGYHETITLARVAVIGRFLGGRDRHAPVSELAGELLGECGDWHYLLRFYSGQRLLSDEARAVWVPPDLGEMR